MQSDEHGYGERMQADWDRRGRENPYYYVSSGREIWTRDEFYQSGKESVKALVLDDLDRLTQGKDPKQMRILELGCGPGRMTGALADCFGEVVAVDISREMIALAQEALQDRPNVRLRQTNGQDLSVLGDTAFDFAFSFIMFQHIPVIEIVESYVRDVARLLRPGGLFKFQAQGSCRLGGKPPDTWLGCRVAAKDVIRWIDRYPLDLLDFAGVGAQYFWLWMRKPEGTSASESEERRTRTADLALQDNSLLSAEIDSLEAELDARTEWAKRLDDESEAMRRYVRSIYTSPAYRVGRRLYLAPQPFRYEPETDSSKL